MLYPYKIFYRELAVKWLSSYYMTQVYVYPSICLEKSGADSGFVPRNVWDKVRDIWGITWFLSKILIINVRMFLFVLF